MKDDVVFKENQNKKRSGFMTTVENEKQESLLLSWDGNTLSVFEKKLKKNVPLHGDREKKTGFVCFLKIRAQQRSCHRDVGVS
jgi:hypothetical protein